MCVPSPPVHACASHLIPTSKRNTKRAFRVLHCSATTWPAKSCVYSGIRAHLGCVHIQRCAKSSPLTPSHCHPLFCLCISLGLCSLSLAVDGDVKYLNTLCCLGTMHSSRWAGAARGRCMQISIQSRPGCFQSSSSASGPVLIPLYPRPGRFFYQVKRLKRCVNLDIWPRHATRREKKKEKT